MIGMGYVTSSATADIMVPIPVSFRVAPSLSISGPLTLEVSSQILTISAEQVILVNMAAAALGIQILNLSGLNVGDAVYLLSPPGSNIIFDCNL